MYWYEKEAPVFSPVLSTRVRFARNLEEFPFPHKMKEEQRLALWEQACRAYEGRQVKAVPFHSLSPLEKSSLVETRLASPALAEAGTGAGLLLSPDGKISIMVGEEDHLRLQAILPGKATEEAFEAALDWCRYGEERLSVARRDGLGYLTACPTNLGAACRISVMIHLPALHAAGSMKKLAAALENRGFTVRGAYGEGSRSEASIYQISNQARGDKSPEELRDAMENILTALEEEERSTAQRLYSADPEVWEDRIGRAIGILRHAKKISYGEFTSLYSLIRFGKALGLEEARSIPLTDRLLVELMPAPMILSHAENQDPKTRDLARSTLLRTLTKQTP